MIKLQYISSLWSYKTQLLSSFFCLFLAHSIIGVTVYGLLESINNTIQIQSFHSGFNRTVWTDLINANPSFIKHLNSSFILTLCVGAFISFITYSGVFISIINKENGIMDWLKNGIKYAIPFLGFLCVGLILFTILTTIIVGCYIYFIGNPLEDFRTEVPFVWATVIAVIKIIFLAQLTGAYITYSKIAFLQGFGFWQSLGKGFKILRSRLLSTIVIVWILILGYAFLTALYIYINGKTNAFSWSYVVGFASLLHIILFARYVWKWVGLKAYEGVKN